MVSPDMFVVLLREAAVIQTVTAGTERIEHGGIGGDQKNCRSAGKKRLEKLQQQMLNQLVLVGIGCAADQHCGLQQL